MLEIIINKSKEQKEIALVENGKLVEYYLDEESIRKEGNIYIGIVKDIVKGMQSAFVNIGTEKNSFIHLKDILDKLDESKEHKEIKTDISTVIKKGQKILVQVKKDSNQLKGARISTHINLPGKYIAIMPNTDIITVSQKIEDKKEQQRLKKLVKENLSTGNGAVIRTSAVGKESEIIEEIKSIEKKWKDIKNKFDNYKSNKPCILLKANNIVQKMIIDLPEDSIKKITVNDKKEYEKIVEIKSRSFKRKSPAPRLVERISLRLSKRRAKCLRHAVVLHFVSSSSGSVFSGSSGTNGFFLEKRMPSTKPSCNAFSAFIHVSSSISLAILLRLRCDFSA